MPIGINVATLVFKIENIVFTSSVTDERKEGWIHGRIRTDERKDSLNTLFLRLLVWPDDGCIKPDIILLK